MNELLKKFFSFSIGGYIALIIGFFTTPIVTRLLSPEQYGIASLFTLVSNLIILICGLGLDQGFVRFFFEEKNKVKLLRKCIKYPIILLILVSIILILFWEKISVIIFGKKNIILIYFLIANIFLLLINRFSILILRMNQKAKTYSLIQVLTQIFNFIFILLLYYKYKDNAEVLIFSTVLSLFITTFISLIIEKNFFKSKNNTSSVLFKELINYSFPIALTVSLNWIFSSSDKIIIKYFKNLTELGLYSAAFKVVSLLSIVQNGFTTFWAPVAYERYNQNSNEREFFEKVFKVVSFLILTIGICILMCKEILVYILGFKYEEASNIMPMLIFMPIMFLLSEVTGLGINFKKKTKFHLYISIIVSIINVLGNLILVPRYGAKGAAISTGISYILFFYLRTYYSLKVVKFKFGIKKFTKLLMFVVIYSIYMTFHQTTLISTGVGMGILLIIFYQNQSLFKEVKKYYLEVKKNERNNISRGKWN